MSDACKHDFEYTQTLKGIMLKVWTRRCYVCGYKSAMFGKPPLRFR